MQESEQLSELIGDIYDTTPNRSLRRMPSGLDFRQSQLVSSSCCATCWSWGMQESEQLSELIGDIYDTTPNRSLWPDVLKRTACFIGAISAAVFWNDAANKSGGVYLHDGGIEPYYWDLYFKKYIKLNPTATRHFFAQVEEPMSTADLLPYDEFLQTRFYQEWARPQGLVDFVSATLEKSTTSAAMFGVFRHERHGMVDEETRGRMRLLVPHIRRAVLIAKVVDIKQTKTAMLTQTLDGLRAAMFLVDASGRIVHANAAGHLLLADGEILSAVANRLVSGNPQIDVTLREIFAAAAEGDTAVGTKGIALPPNEGTGERHVAHVLPLASGLRKGAGLSHAAAAAVFVHRTSLETPPAPEAIAEAYKLTPTELRVLLAVVEVGGVPAVAEALGVADSTVKTHLGRVYEKTGVGRQADLVKLVAGFTSPLLR